MNYIKQKKQKKNVLAKKAPYNTWVENVFTGDTGSHSIAHMVPKK